MPNDLKTNQAYTIINELNQQSTGEKTIAPIDLTEFVAVADKMLKTGYDPVLNAISQTLGRTIFSIRPYTAKFKGLMRSEEQFGNHVRKLQTLDKDFEKDDRFDLIDGQAVDMYKVNKPRVIQTNFYGADTYQKSLTYFKDQIDNAFRSPQELVDFSSMYTQNASDTIEMTHENTARATVANLIAGTYQAYDAQTDKDLRVIKLVTLYNEETGQTLTTDSVKAPENYPNFIKWAYAKIRSITALMTERTEAFNVMKKGLKRHTPYNRMKLYISAPEMYSIETRVFGDLFNDEYMKLVDHEEVNYWQSIDAPDGVNVKANYLDPTEGEIKQADVIVSDIFAIAFDEEAAGMTTINKWTGATPFNVRGGYTNFFWHFTERYWNDFSENVCLFLLQ